jgi:hypothetical protein
MSIPLLVAIGVAAVLLAGALMNSSGKSSARAKRDGVEGHTYGGDGGSDRHEDNGSDSSGGDGGGGGGDGGGGK